MNCLKLVWSFQCRSVHSYKPLAVQTLYQLKIKPANKCFSANKFLACYMHDYEVNSAVQDNYRKLDKVSKDYDIIYRAPLLNYVKYGHYCSALSGVILPTFTTCYFAFNGPYVFPIHLGNMPLIRDYFDFCAFYLGFFFMVGQIFLVVSRYPLRVYTNRKGKYIAIFRGILPWSLVNYEFQTGDFVKANSILPWGDSLYKTKTKTKTAILFEDHFLRPIDLHNMLGQSVSDNKEE